MRERDKLHARKDSRYKTIKHQVQKKFRAAHWQYVEEIITPNRTPSMPPISIATAGITKLLGTDPLIKRSTNPSIYITLTDIAIRRTSDLLIYRTTDLAVYRSTDLQIYWSTDPPKHGSKDPLIHRSTNLLIYRSIHLQIHRTTDLVIQWSTHSPIHRSTDL